MINEDKEPELSLHERPVLAPLREDEWIELAAYLRDLPSVREIVQRHQSVRAN